MVNSRTKRSVQVEELWGPAPGTRMTSKKFRAGLESALADIGYIKEGRSFRREGQGATVLVALQYARGGQWFVNVGFWLHGLGARSSEKVEHCHLYFRLEGLVRDELETIRTAGALQEAEQPAAFEKLLSLLRGPIGHTLESLCSERTLRSAIGWMTSRGLVRHEARTYLTTSLC